MEQQALRLKFGSRSLKRSIQSRRSAYKLLIYTLSAIQHVCTRLSHLSRTDTGYGGPRDTRVDARIVPACSSAREHGPLGGDTGSRCRYAEQAATAGRHKSIRCRDGRHLTIIVSEVAG
jgi:hypothetical protein